MAAGDDVIDITWKPQPSGTGPGEATIAHWRDRNVTAPMTREAALRMADKFFGPEKTEVPITGNGARWLPAESHR